MTRPEATLPEHTECVRADLRGGPRVSRTPGALARASYANCCQEGKIIAARRSIILTSRRIPGLQGPREAAASSPAPGQTVAYPPGKRTHRGDRTGTRTPQPPGLGRLAPPAPLILSAQTVLVPEPGPRPRGLCGAPRWPLTLQPSILRVHPRTCVCVCGGGVVHCLSPIISHIRSYY